MIDVDNQPDLDDVLNTLSTPYTKPKKQKESIMEDLDDDEVYNFVLSQLKDAIDANAEVIEQSKDMVAQVGTPELIEAHSKLVKTQTDLLGSMMSTMMDRKKLAQTDKHKTKDLELKERALDEKKSYGDGPLGGTTNIQNNYLLANRDDLFDSLYETDPERRIKAQLKIKEANGIIVESNS